MDAARDVAGPRAALCFARPGGGADRRGAAVHPDRRAGALVARSPAASRTSPGTVTPATRSPTWKQSRSAETEAMRIDEQVVLPPVGTDPQSVRQRVEAMEKLLERLVVIPGIKQAGRPRRDPRSRSGRRRHRRRGARRLYRLGSEERRHVQVADGADGGQCRLRLAARALIPWVGAIPRLLLPLEHPQPEDDQAPPRQASSRHRTIEGEATRALAAAGDPFVLAVDVVGDRPAIAVGARAIAEALHDQPAGQRVELRHAARTRDRAAADPAVRLDPEGYANEPADAAIPAGCADNRGA